MRTDVWQTLHTDLAPGLQPDGETYATPLGPHHLLLPLRTLPDGRRVASLIVNQASFAVLDALCDALASALTPYKPDVVIGVPTLGLPMAEGVARRLGHSRMIPLGISRKFWYDDALSVPLRSITTPGGGKTLYLDPRMKQPAQRPDRESSTTSYPRAVPSARCCPCSTCCTSSRP
jgi:hypothetical protein